MSRWGYHLQTTRRGLLTYWPRKKSEQKLKDTVRAKTKRNNGCGLQAIVCVGAQQ
ncbi:MAG: hypothetical protein K2R98_32200 [Gemmataceae bacterium]|nr:hypothetical protein [Gemmataceae bacterium]